MPRFLLAVFFAFALIFSATWVFVVMYPMAYFNKDYPDWKYLSDEFLSQCNVGTVAFIGDSTAQASIIPKEVGAGAMNFATGGAKTADYLMISKHLLSCSTPPKAVVLITTFTGFEYERECCFWEHAVKWDFLHIRFGDLEHLLRLARQNNDDTMFGAPSLFDIDAQIHNFLYTIKFPSYYFGSLINTTLTARLEANKKLYAEAVGKRGWVELAKGHGNWDPNFVGSGKEFTPPKPFQLALLDEMMELYQAHHVALYYMAPPYKASDAKNFTPEMEDAYRNFWADYEKRYPNFHVLGDIFLVYPNKIFGDITHVNADGAKLYSNYIAQLLTERQVDH